MKRAESVALGGLQNSLWLRNFGEDKAKMKAVTRLQQRLDWRKMVGAYLAFPAVCSRVVRALPPGIALKSKTNLRSALESTKVLKNEPETNPNEPEAIAPANG
jgi:hypothetical protein